MLTSRVDSSLNGSTRLAFLKVYPTERKEGRTQELKLKSSTNGQEGFQNLDDSTRIDSVRLTASLEVAKARSKIVRNIIAQWGLQHAWIGPFRSRPV